MEVPKIEIIGNTETMKDPFMEEEKKLTANEPENVETERKMLDKEPLETNFEKQMNRQEVSSSSFDSSFEK